MAARWATSGSTRRSRLRKIKFGSALTRSHIRNIGCEPESVRDMFLTSLRGLTARDTKFTTAVVITKPVDMTEI